MIEAIAKVRARLRAGQTTPCAQNSAGDPASPSFMNLVSSYGMSPTQEGFDEIYRRYLADCDRAANPAHQAHLVGSATATSKAMLDVSIERHRQVMTEGWAPSHDDAHKNGEIAGAAACYILHGLDAKIQNISLGHRVCVMARDLWPWAQHWWKPTNRRRDLVKAAVLIIAEIERLDRADKASLDAIAGMTEDQI